MDKTPTDRQQALEALLAQEPSKEAWASVVAYVKDWPPREQAIDDV